MAAEASSLSALGSDSWLGVDEYEPGSELYVRATEFLATVKWDLLANIASKHKNGMSCRYEDKFSIGHFNMVRRIVFKDDTSWVARLLFWMTMSKTSIPVPKVFDYNTSLDNEAGAPYIMMEYIHGTVASDLYNWQPVLQSFFIGPELQTGKGPWASSDEYYDDLVEHLLKSIRSIDDIKEGQSFMVPSILSHLMRIHGEEKAGPFRLTNRDFGAHNILLNDDFDIIGVIDFDGVMAAPLEVLLDGFESEQQQGKGGIKVANRLGSTSPSIYRGMAEYASHQVFVNEYWMESCLKMLRVYAENE
ncbi:hypothetical protein B0H63DRAFT_501844 [Podospora didyma]|uniref:Aminoglycoside phosphotransferase domain-containing protein n=1 Tax=Podospora didyma TaxID=330526 RepID=A0AAE0NGN9_9PEZI|nr:hypothetical protein B0H63DRAFT_501844 [Podospora didyma]